MIETKPDIKPEAVPSSGLRMKMKREGIRPPKFAEKFAYIDFDAFPMPVLCLYPIPEPVGLESLELSVAGLECKPRVIPWSSLSDLPRFRLRAPLVCQIFNWFEWVTWEGVRLCDFLERAGLEAHPEGYYSIHSRDGVYFETISHDEAMDPRVLLATHLNDEPLPELHGGPLRLVVPFLQGYKSVKWVGAIRATRHDPVGIKRLLAQSKTGRLGLAWRRRLNIAPAKGKAGDP